MKLSFKHLLFMCLLFFFYSVSFAQLSDTSKVISLSAQELYFNRSDNEEKMSSDLFYMVVHFLKETYKGQAVQKVITELKKDEFSTFDDKNRLLVFIRLKSNSKSDETQLVNLINNNGGEVYHQEVGHNNLSEITAYLPIQAIIKIAENENTALIKKPIPILFHTYTSAGDEQLKAQQVRQLFNVDGSNIKIGVISDGADKWSQAYGANELPMISIIRNGSGDEGTAMMEIIHDIAPSSELIFAGVRGLLYPVNWAFIAGLVNELHYTRGCKIIVDDFYTPEEPFFSDEGLFGEAIRNFINDGGVYITAAGNSRKSLYSGITSLGSGYHIFPDGKDYLEFVLEGSDYLYLQWSTSWINPSLDLDFEALNTTTNTTYYSSSNQSYTTPPIENLDLTEPGVYRLKIKKRTGLETVEFKILSVRDNNIPNNNTNQIFGHSAYPNVISVAAYQANNQNTTSDYSSIGPALMYSAAIGQWTVQKVPTITATSGVETWVGSTGLWSGGYPVFDGTSASAPHIAGLAALYFHKLNGINGLNKSNLDFKNDLTLSAATIESGTTGGTWNNKSGFGKADILSAINLGLGAVATPIVMPTGGNYNSPQFITITCATENANIFYTDDGSEPSESSILYTDGFWINTNKTIKAKAFKTGLLPSLTATESYLIESNPISVTVIPGSGIYPYGKKIQAFWPSGYECWYTYTTNGLEPPSPQSINGGNYLVLPGVIILADNKVWKMKFQLFKDGIWQSSITYVQYDIRPALRIAQIDDEITQGNNSFGFWNKWEDNQWNSHPDETIVRPTQTSDWFIRASQEFKDTDVFRKFNVWTTNQGTNYFVNHAKIPIGPNTSSVLAHFKQTYDVTVTNKLENSFSVNQGNFIFKDPWIVDDNSDSKGPRNRGDGTVAPLLPYTINFSTSPNITTSSIHKGVFLNQRFDIPNNPYYSVKADYVQNIQLQQTGRTHTFYFQDWSATPQGSATFQNANAIETPVVFNQENATVQANLKGTQLSNNPNAYSKGSQRKFIRITNGRLFSVYESMGNIYLERSTDNGTSWDLYSENSRTKLNDLSAHSPAIDFYYHTGIGDVMVISFVEELNQDYARVVVVFILDNNNTTSQILTKQEVDWVYRVQIGYGNPVVACAGSGKFIVAFKGASANSGTEGIIYRRGLLSRVPAEDGTQRWEFNWIEQNPNNLPVVQNSNSYSINPTIAEDRNTAGINYQLAWEQADEIYYCKFVEDASGNIAQTNHSIISNGSSYMFHTSPSIIAIDSSARVCWNGYDDEVPPNKKVVFRDPSVNHFYSFGFNTSAPSINKSNDNSYFAISWSEGNNTIKFVDNQLKSIYEVAGISGKDVQLSNGPNRAGMYANIFNATTQPYYFTVSHSLNSYYDPQYSEQTAECKSGIVRKSEGEIYFRVGDVKVEDEKIKFKECPPDADISSVAKLNQYLETKPFEIDDNSGFEYTVEYGVIDTSVIRAIFGEGEKVRFKVELIDNNSGDDLGVYDDVIYNRDNIAKFVNQSYYVNTQGVGSRTVKLRFRIEENISPQVSMLDSKSGESVIAKKGIKKEIKYQGKMLPEEYVLEQNYPNPFNPRTVI